MKTHISSQQSSTRKALHPRKSNAECRRINITLGQDFPFIVKYQTEGVFHRICTMLNQLPLRQQGAATEVKERFAEQSE